MNASVNWKERENYPNVENVVSELQNHVRRLAEDFGRMNTCNLVFYLQKIRVSYKQDENLQRSAFVSINGRHVTAVFCGSNDNDSVLFERLEKQYKKYLHYYTD